MLRGQSFTLTAVCIMTFTYYLAVFMRVPLIPLYAVELGASTLQVGIIASSYMVVAAAMGFPIGSYVDRRGRRGVIIAGMAVSAVASLLLPLAGDVFSVAVFYAFIGAGMGACSPAIAAVVGDISHASAMGRSYGWFTTSMQVGMAGGPALGAVVASMWGYGSAFILSAVVAFMALPVAVFWLKEPHVEIPVTTEVTQPSKGIRPWKLGVLVMLGWLGTFTYAFTFGVVFPFFPLYADNAGIALGLIGVLLAVQSVFNAVARIPMAYLSDRTGRRVPFIVSGLVILSAGTALCVATDSFVALLVVFAALGLANGTVNMAIATSLAESTPPGTRGVAMGGQSTARFAGFAASPLMAGALIPAVGYMSAFSVAAMVSVLGAVAYVVFARRAVEPRAGRL